MSSLGKSVLISVAVLAISHISLSQCKNWFLRTKSKFKGIEISMTIEEKKALLEEYSTSKWELLDDDEYFKSFHAIHLNSDSLIDFIYEGYQGGESSLVSILLNQNGKFVVQEEKSGRILNIEKLAPSMGLLINFEQYGCCDDPSNWIQTWVIRGSRSRIVIDKTPRIYYLKGTRIPDCFTINSRFEVVNKPYTLRCTPQIIDDPEIIHNYDRGNIVAEFGTGDSGTALASYEDETGRVWWFVVMEKPKHQDVFHNFKIFRNERWAGWMSSRYLQSR